MFEVLPFFHRIDHAALQFLEREYRRLVVNELAHKQIAEIVGAVFLFQLIQIEQRAAPGERILDGDNLTPLTIRAQHATGERLVADIDVDPVCCAAASPVKQLT
ncbi:hypothetical protein D3C72_2154090 [compost metagenome]